MNKLLIAPEGMHHLNDESTKGMITSPLCQNGDATPRQDGSRWSRHLILSFSNQLVGCWLGAWV